MFDQGDGLSLLVHAMIEMISGQEMIARQEVIPRKEMISG